MPATTAQKVPHHLIPPMELPVTFAQLETTAHLTRLLRLSVPLEPTRPELEWTSARIVLRGTTAQDWETLRPSFAQLATVLKRVVLLACALMAGSVTRPCCRWCLRMTASSVPKESTAPPVSSRAPALRATSVTSAPL